MTAVTAVTAATAVIAVIAVIGLTAATGVIRVIASGGDQTPDTRQEGARRSGGMTSINHSAWVL